MIARLRVGVHDGDVAEMETKPFANAFGSRFYIPLDFDQFESHMAFYQSAIPDRLEYDLNFNDYSRVIQTSGDVNASYSIDSICLHYDMVTQPELAREIRNQYADRLKFLYDRDLYSLGLCI